MSDTEPTSNNPKDGQLPGGWTRTPLSDLVGFSPKIDPKALDADTELTFVPMPSVAEVSGVIDLTKTIGAKAGKKKNLTYFEDGDVIFAKITPCMENGKIARPAGLLNGAAFGSTEFHVLRPSTSINGEFLRYRLVLDDFRHEAERAMTGAVGQRRVPRKFLENYLIALPPLAEQERIVEILEEQLSRLDAALESVRVVREKAAQFRRSLLHAAFTGTLTGHNPADGQLPEGWDLMRITEVLEKLPNGKLINQGKSPQCEKEPSTDESVWGVLKTTAIQAGEFLPEHNKRLPDEIVPSEGIEVNEGDLLLTCAGPRVRGGVPCLVRTTRPRLLLSGKMYRFRANQEIADPNFLEFFLLSPSAQEAIDDMKTGTSESGLNLTHGRFSELPVPVPPLLEQERIVAILEEQLSRLDAALAVADAIEKRSAALRRSLLHAAFTGRLTEQWRESVHV